VLVTDIKSTSRSAAVRPVTSEASIKSLLMVYYGTLVVFTRFGSN